MSNLKLKWMRFIYKYLMPKEFIGFAFITHYFTPGMDVQAMTKKTVFEWCESMERGKYEEGNPLQRKSSKEA